MKKIAIFCLLALLLQCFTPVFAVEATEDISVLQGSNTIDSNNTLLGSQKLIENSISAILYEISTDTMLYAHNADEKIFPASLVKIMTALIAIEQGELTDAVTVREDVLALVPEDALVADLYANEVVTVEDLLYCMMVASGNDAAAILADHIAGSQDAFVAEMNRYAAELGCTGTNFTNAHGLHDIDQYTTARDMTKILTKAFENDTFSTIFQKRYYTVPETNKFPERYLATENYLLSTDDSISYYDERVLGSRAGTADDRTRNIASIAREGDMTVVCIICGAKSVYEEDGYTIKVTGGYSETLQLLDLGLEGYKTAQILYPDLSLMQCKVTNGSSDVFIGPNASMSTVIPDSFTAEDLQYRYTNDLIFEAPIEKGQLLSSVQVWCGQVCVAQTELYALNSVTVTEQHLQSNGSSKGLNFINVLLYAAGAVIVFVIAAFLCLYLLRIVRIANMKKRGSRYRRSRRRSR